MLLCLPFTDGALKGHFGKVYLDLPPYSVAAKVLCLLHVREVECQLIQICEVSVCVRCNDDSFIASPKQPFESSLHTSWRPCTLNCKPLKTLYWCILGVWHVIECEVIQGCEVGITVRLNDNVDFPRLFCICFYCLQTFNSSVHVVAHWVLDHAHQNDSHGMNATMIAQPHPISSLIPFNRLAYAANYRPVPIIGQCIHE